MKIFLIAFAAFVLAFLGMSIGVLVRNRGIKGSCGGLGAAGERDDQSAPCETCSLWWLQCRSKTKDSFGQKHERT